MFDRLSIGYRVPVIPDFLESRRERNADADWRRLTRYPGSYTGPLPATSRLGYDETPDSHKEPSSTAPDNPLVRGLEYAKNPNVGLAKQRALVQEATDKQVMRYEQRKRNRKLNTHSETQENLEGGRDLPYEGTPSNASQKLSGEPQLPPVQVDHTPQDYFTNNQRALDTRRAAYEGEERRSDLHTRPDNFHHWKGS